MMVELLRIDTLWHFFATQNSLFLKKRVEPQVSYTMEKIGIQLIHVFNPKFPEHSSLTLQSSGFKVARLKYKSAKKRFGIKEPFQKTNEKIFFPKELLKLTNLYSFYAEKDCRGLMKVTVMPFQPKTMTQILYPVNLVSKVLWKTRFFSETIKN